MLRLKPPWSEQQVDEIVGNLLRAGVNLAAVVVAVGGILYVVRHGGATPVARVTWPPEKIVMYADGSNSRWTTTMPPAALMVCREEKLVTTTDHRGNSTTNTSPPSASALPSSTPH